MPFLGLEFRYQLLIPRKDLLFPDLNPFCVALKELGTVPTYRFQHALRCPVGALVDVAEGEKAGTLRSRLNKMNKVIGGRVFEKAIQAFPSFCKLDIQFVPKPAFLQDVEICREAVVGAYRQRLGGELAQIARAATGSADVPVTMVN